MPRQPGAGGQRDGGQRDGGQRDGGQRADARRNRARILDVAFTAFAREGLGVSIQAIARRAGVSTGTVSRHFPTKDELFTAIVLDRAERLVATARALGEGEPAGTAFYRFIEVMALEGAQNRGMGEALAGAGFDVQAAAAGADQDLMGAWNGLLTHAQAAGAVRADVTIDDVKAMIIGCAFRDDPDPGQAAVRRMLSVIKAGLQPTAIT
jgi:AcrR family transcriptional regulator